AVGSRPGEIHAARSRCRKSAGHDRAAARSFRNRHDAASAHRDLRSVRKPSALTAAMLPQTKLDILIARHAELEARLAGQISPDEFVELSGELSDLGPVVDAIRNARAVGAELKGVEALVDDPPTGSEVREIAASERHGLRERLEKLGTDLRIELLP